MVAYNKNDDLWYGTHNERLADTVVIKSATSKWYEYDTGQVFVTDGTQWHIM